MTTTVAVLGLGEAGGRIAADLAAADETTAGRLEQGTHQHAPRRVHEMAAASDMLGEPGVPPRVARASQRWLEELSEN